MAGSRTTVTQEKVYLAVRAFYHVHGRRPAIIHLMTMLKTSAHQIRRRDLTVVETVPLKREYIEAAKRITVLTEEQICEKKAAAGKSTRRKHNREKLEDAIERVVRKAKVREANRVDVMHDYRKPFPRTAIKAVRIG